MAVSTQLVNPSDLATYLNDTTINFERADMLLADAQTLCESIVSPLPQAASIVIKRVTARAYGMGPRQQQLAEAGSPYAQTPVGVAELSLMDEDIADLRRFAGGGGAFSIDLLPDGYVAPVLYADPYTTDWDTP